MRAGLAFGMTAIVWAAPAFADGSDQAAGTGAGTGTNELPPEETKPAKPEGLIVPVSIMGGVRIGGAWNVGNNAPDSASKPNGAVAGIDLALEVGSTVFDHFYGGLIFGGTLFISPQSTTSSVSSVLVGTEFGYITNPRMTDARFGGFFGLGVAYRAIFVSDALGNANKFDSPDLLLTAALHLRLASYLRLMPRLDFSLGPTPNWGTPHAIFIVGVSAWFNADVWPPKGRHRQSFTSR